MARPPGPLRRTWRQIRRRSRPILVVSAVLSVVLIAGFAVRLVALRWRAEGLVLEAIRQASGGDRAGAAASLDRALELWPELAEAHFRQAQLVLEGEADPARALVSLSEALDHDPQHVGSLLTRGRLLRERGDAEAALRDFARARELTGTTDPRPHLWEGLALGDAGRADEAADRLREGLRLARAARAPHDELYVEAVRTLGSLELEVGDPRAALAELEETVRLLPLEGEPQVLLARALIANDNLPAAVEALSAALRRDEDQAEARELRGRTLRRLGRYRLAFEDLDRVAEDPSARLLRGLIRFETVDHQGGGPLAFEDEAARSDLERAAEDPSLSSRERALALMALGWLELTRERAYRVRALERFDRALELLPQATGAHLARAVVLLEWGHHDEAAASFERARAADPAAGYAALVGLARLAADQGEAARARELLDQAVALAPERTTAWGDRYRVRLAAGDPGAAEDRARAIAAPGSATFESPPFDEHADPFLLAERAHLMGLKALESAVEAGGDEDRWFAHLTGTMAWMSRALVFDPRSLPATARLANARYLVGDFAAAEELYGRAHALDPGLVEAELTRAMLQRAVLPGAGAEAAERTLRDLAGADMKPASRAWLHEELARALVAQGRLEEALAEVDRAVALAPRRHAPASLRARLLSRLGRPGVDAAVDVAARLFYEGDRQRNMAMLYAQAADQLTEAGRDQGALHLATRAIGLDPLNGLAWRTRAGINFRGDPSQLPSAFVDAFVSAELDPGFAARFMEYEARFQQFVRILPILQERVEDILARTPDLPAAPFFRGYLFFYQGAHDRAERWFDQAYTLSRGRSFLSLAYRGAARLRQGDTSGARADLERARQLDDQNPIVHFWQACLLSAEGDVAGAVQLLEAAAARGLLRTSQVEAAPELAPVLRHPRLRRFLR